MIYNKLGNTNLEVSDVGFGAWAIGGTAWGKDRDDDAAKLALKTAMDLGINFYDTCDAYGDGHSERLLGDFFKDIRDEVVIVTKGGTNFRVPERPKNFSKEYLIMCVEESLQRLKTDYIDLYLLHVPDSDWQEKANVFETLEDIKNSGKAKFCGLAMWGAKDTLNALKMDTKGVIDAIECPFNILNKSNIEVIKIAKERGIAIFTSQPLASGILTGKYGPETVFADGDNRKGFWNTDRFESIRNDMLIIDKCSKETGLKMHELALAYNLTYPGISNVIPGARNSNQVCKNVKASGKRLNNDIMNKLSRIKGFVF